MRDQERERLAEAVRFALHAHGEQTRKGGQIPYVSHLLQVAGLVLEHGGDPEQAVAAVLHDAVEDCEQIEIETIRARFGPGVGAIVAQCTDVLPGDRPGAKSPWLVRKRRYAAQLAQADQRTRLVAACDKLHNLRTLVADLRVEGSATLERFTGTPEQTRGYYEALRGCLAPGLPERLLYELDALLKELRGFVATSSFDG